jgi:uncharacterized membrane protein YraQ (UPF0718 family)
MKSARPRKEGKNLSNRIKGETRKDAFFKTTQAFSKSLPILASVLMLLAVANTLIPRQAYKLIFTGNELMDSLMGAAIGSISAGNPITSYIIGGELRQEGVSMLAITAFIVAWVTVGIIQLPAEALMLGKRFAIARNAVSFCLSIGIAILTVLTLGMGGE